MSRLKIIDPIIASAVTAVLSTALVHSLSSRQFELCSELLCWIFLPLFFAIEKSLSINTQPRTALSHNSGTQNRSEKSLWVVASCITIVCCFRAEIGMITLFPALTPLLMIIQEHFGLNLQLWKLINTGFFSFPINKIWGAALVACVAILTTPDWNLLGLALSIIPAATMLLVYMVLIPKRNGTRFVLSLDFDKAIVPLSVRVTILLFIALAVQVAMFSIPSVGIMHMLSLSFAKALSWYFLAKIARHTSWCIAPAILTFSIVSAPDQFMQYSEVQASLQLVVSVLCLSPVIHMLPKQAKAKCLMWGLLLIPIVPYLRNGVATRNLISSTPFTSGGRQDHPVEFLVRKAKDDFERMLQRQSQTYTAAAQEYRHRYNLEPPPGFEAWYNFATANESPIIDEFDAVFNMISPFLRLSGKDVLKGMTNVQNVPDIDLWSCTFSSDEAATYCSHPSRTFDRNIAALFDTLLGNLGGRVPDVTFLVNHLDEPRVLSHPGPLQERNLFDNGEFVVTDLSRQPTWDAVTKFCESQQNGTNSETEQAIDTFGLPFVSNHSSTLNLCQVSEYSTMHGLFMSPTSFRLVEGLVPILSTGSLSIMGDILFPSPAYLDSDFKYNKDHDVDWSKKKNNLYWAGSTTGGFASDELWQNFHRQRFVKSAQNLDKENYYLREKDGIISPEKSTFLNGRLFDVAFTRIFQCERKFCREQRNYFKSKSWEDKDRALRSKLVFDLDGNGISGRYYKLLASNSAPLKQTIFREWHDDRLIPWVHYIPVSLSMEELPELVFYLTSTEAGQRRAKEIAVQGQEWFLKAFRDVDLSIYIYRLLLELARLQDPDRLAS